MSGALENLNRDVDSGFGFGETTFCELVVEHDITTNVRKNMNNRLLVMDRAYQLAFAGSPSSARPAVNRRV